MDTGRYVESSSKIILYVIRLFVRVEGFLKTIIGHHKWATSGGEGGCNGFGHTWVRGIKVKSADLYERAHRKMQYLLYNNIFPMLERWCNTAIKNNELHTACILHAHLVFLFKNVNFEELNFDAVSTCLSSQIFLTTRHEYDIDTPANADKKKEKEKEMAIEHSLLIPDVEMFDLFQKLRSKIMKWLKENPRETNKVMEAVVRVVTLTGTRVKATATESSELTKVRNWRSMTGRNCEGRFVPKVHRNTASLVQVDLLAGAGAGKVSKVLNFGEFMRRRQAEMQCDTEINIQLGDFTLTTSRLERLSNEIQSMADFRSIFGQNNQPLQCAQVKMTVHRKWYRLVGRRHDVLIWNPDTRTPSFNLNRKYSPHLLCW